MGTSEQFTRADIRRILDVSEKQLNQWERLQFVAELEAGKKETYDFRDLIRLRTTKQLLANGVTPDRLRRSLEALQVQLAEVRSPLDELRITSNGRDVIVEREGARMEPISGQFSLNFSTRELVDKVRVMPERNAEALFALALEYDAAPDGKQKAMEAYERVLALDAKHVEALLNRGMIAYEDADLETALGYFRQAVELEPDNPVARFDLGTTLDELGVTQEARQHLRLATRLDPRYADAHYNLAVVCEKAGAASEAREHWMAYVRLEPGGEHGEYARARLKAIG